MFQFPSLPPRILFYSDASTSALPLVGFPIRKSRDQRSVSTSSGLIAAAHVLHRLLAPRHPPCALSLLIVKNTLYAAMEFSRCTPAPKKSGQTRESRSTAGLSKLSSATHTAARAKPVRPSIDIASDVEDRGRRNSRRARNRTYSSRPSSPRSKALRIP